MIEKVCLAGAWRCIFACTLGGMLTNPHRHKCREWVIKPMNNNMTAMSYQDFPRLKKQKPFSLEEERANALTVGKAEIGLLDIVILDAIAENEACQY
jgi:hypothetical protein